MAKNEEGVYTYLKDTGDGYWMSYDSGRELINHVNDQDETIQDQAELIAVLRESLKNEREQSELVIDLYEDLVNVKDEKEKIQADIISLQKKEIKQLKDQVKTKADESIKTKAKWGSRGAVIGALVVLILMAGS